MKQISLAVLYTRIRSNNTGCVYFVRREAITRARRRQDLSGMRERPNWGIALPDECYVCTCVCVPCAPPTGVVMARTRTGGEREIDFGGLEPVWLLLADGCRCEGVDLGEVGDEPTKQHQAAPQHHQSTTHGPSASGPQSKNPRSTVQRVRVDSPSGRSGWSSGPQ